MSRLATRPAFCAAVDAEAIEALRRRLDARLIETHISWVLLAGDDAWKIKKPVRLPFLDFSTLEARRRLCEEELRLNARLAPSLYLEVVPITWAADAPRLGGEGRAIEYALHMRRFPDGALLTERLAMNDLPPQLIDRLARRIAAFHRDAPAAGPASPWGRPERIAEDMHAVIERLAPHLGGERSAELARLGAWAKTEAGTLRGVWQERRDAGCVREGHGDLHLANAVVLGDDVTGFDCIEFDPALRWIDVQAEIAFPIMDLLARGRHDLAYRFLDRYLEDSGDHAGLTVLRWYIVQRALVRALVSALHPAGAPDYLELALRWTRPPGARLLITHGLSGSGKSFAAERLLECAGAVRLRSDVERKRLFGLAPLGASGGVEGGIYRADATERTYERLRERAAVALAAGWPVIVDAAFLMAAERDAFRRLARGLAVPFSILHCEAPAALLRSRVAARRERRDDPSEADEGVLALQLRRAEPLAQAECAETITVDTSAPLDASALAAQWLVRT